MGIRKIEDKITLDFTTHNSFTGAVQDTDLIPTCEIFEDDNDTAILTPTVTKRVGKIGNYRISIEATTLNGFEVGKSYNVIISATVNSISAKSRISSFTLDSKRNADLNDLAQSQILSDAVPLAGASIDLIKIETDKIQPEIIDNKDAYKADVSNLALNSTVAKEVTLNTKASQASIDLIKAETDKIKFILGLSQENYRLFDIVYSGDLITSTTIKTYPTSNDCENNTNVLATYSVVATYDSNGKLLTYKVKKV